MAEDGDPPGPHRPQPARHPAGEGRISNAELAERVHLSASACLRRVQRLEAEGVITGYAARLDPAALGLGLQAFVRLQLARTMPTASRASSPASRPGTRSSPATR
jgi:DNA-binding Lrp family transcriptional regulator